MILQSSKARDEEAKFQLKRFSQRLTNRRCWKPPLFWRLRLLAKVSIANDYLHKLAEYETLRIPEYWIVDYLALGASRYIGKPRQPAISIYQWVDGEYQVSPFQGSARLVSTTFPELKLTAEQVLKA